MQGATGAPHNAPGVMMSRTSLRASAALVSAATVASLVGLAGPAMAQGGSHPTPDPAPVALDCSPGNPAIAAMTDSDVAVNYAGDAGCVGVRLSDAGLKLAWVMLADGWSYDVRDNGTGTNSRVQLRFVNRAADQKVDFRFERGK